MVDSPWWGFVLCTFFVCWAGVAQLVEQLICNQQVGGSSPLASSTPSLVCLEEDPRGF